MVCRSYDVGGIRFGVRTTSETFGEWFVRALSAYEVDGECEGEYSIVTADREPDSRRRGFHILYKGTLPLVRSLDMADLAQGLLADIETLLFPERDDALYLGVVPVRVGDSRVLLPGSTIPYLAALGGHTRRAGVALPWRMTTAIDLGTGEVLPLRGLLQIPDEARSFSSGSGSSNGRSVAEPGEEGAVDVVLPWGLRGEGMLEPLSKATALYYLATQAINLEKVKGRGVTALGPMVDGARCFALGRGYARDILEALKSTAAAA